MATLTGIKPAAAADDCSTEPSAPSWSSDIICGEYYGAHKSGIRFVGVNAVNNSAVSSAVITFRSNSAYAVDTCKVKIRGEPTATPATFSTYADFAARGRTTAFVNWTIAAWTINAYYDSPNFAAVLQEIFALPAWASGSNLAVFFDDDGSSTGARRYPYSRGDSATYCPNLAITFTAPAATLYIPGVMCTHFIPPLLGGY